MSFLRSGSGGAGRLAGYGGLAPVRRGPGAPAGPRSARAASGLGCWARIPFCGIWTMC